MIYIYYTNLPFVLIQVIFEFFIMINYAYPNANRNAKPIRATGSKSMGGNGAFIGEYERGAIMATKASTIASLAARVTKFFDPISMAPSKDFNITSAFNSWINVYPMESTHESYTFDNSDDRGRRIVKCTITYGLTSSHGVLKLVGRGYGTNQKMAKEKACISVMMNCLPNTQMDTEQGDVEQMDDKQSNTIVTRDGNETKYEETQITYPNLISICSTEPTHSFDSVMDRWMALPGIEIKTTDVQESEIKTYTLPSFLYTESSAPNMMPFENFVFGIYDIEFKFVVNANKFHVGKVLVSLKYDPYQMTDRRNSLVANLCRPHIILDLSVNNEGNISVPFKYHRTFVRNAKFEQSQFGLQHAQYATLSVSILSPLLSATGNPLFMYIRPYYRIKKAALTGMNYRLPLAQMEGIILEEGLKYAGKILNCDKPIDLQRQAIVIPKTRMNFSSGKGAVDVMPMRIDPSTMTSFLPDHDYPEDPTDMMDIARIWGLAWSFKWSINDAENKILSDQAIDPTFHCGAGKYSGTPSPLEYVCSMYQFWSGPIEVRLDFVTNAFHTGAVMLSAEFGRASQNYTQASSTYTKTFHLGAQKSVNFIIPYIFDTPYRRTSCVPYTPLGKDGTYTPEALVRLGRNALLHEVTSRFKVTVMNKLVPIQSVAQTIEVLVFWRAGKNFTCHAPIMANLINTEVASSMVEFPGTNLDFPRSIGATQIAASIEAEREHIDKPPAAPGADRTTFTGPIDPRERDEDAYPVIYKGIRTWAYDSKPNAVGETVQYVWYDKKWQQVLEKVPRAQMDTGDKESLDPTSDFSQGGARNFTMSVDKHTNIKDLLRRPIMVLENVWYTGWDSAADRSMTIMYIPCMPPSRLWGLAQKTEADGYTQNKFANGLIRSYHTHILDLFRFWRGSQRFTFVFRAKSSDVIYISYIPHSGARIIGPVSYDRSNALGDNTLTVNPATMGLPTEIIVPSINPTGTIEVPFEMETNWALMQEQYASDNYSWRDKGEYNVGHLLVWSRSQFTMDVFWAAGDDFAVKNFYGIPPCKTRIRGFYMNDNAPQSQMDSGEDFPNSDVGENISRVSRIWNYISSFKRPVAMAAVASIPIVGTPAVIGSISDSTLNTLQTVSDNAKKMTAATNNTLKNIDQLSCTANDMLMNLNNLIGEKFGSADSSDAAFDIFDFISRKVASFIDKAHMLYNIVVNTALDIVHNLLEFSVTTLTMSIIRFVSNVVGVGISAIITHFDAIKQYITDIFTVTSQGDIATEHLSANFWQEDTLKKGLGLFVALIGTAIGVKMDVRATGSWSSSLLNRLCSAGGMSFLNGTMRFVEAIFEMLREATFKIIEYYSPENRALIKLREQSAVLDKFIKECQLVTNEINTTMFSNPDFKLRFWVNVVNAYEIQRQLVKIPTNKLSPIISKYCNDMIKLGKEKMADLKTSPVRFEPYVICIYGKSRVGKSACVTNLASSLLESIGVKTIAGNPIFFRIQGAKFWNDYNGQPVVVIDEWLNMSDPQTVLEGIRELFQLKSAAVFIPEQAAIEEKKIRANPKLVILLCNEPFPETLVNNAVHTKEAVYGRRDLLIEMKRAPAYDGIDGHGLDEAVKRNYEHLLLRTQSPVDPNFCSPGEWKTYPEMLADIQTKFKMYIEQENENVKIRMSELQRIWAVGTYNITDPFTLFQDGLQQISANNSVSRVLPSEILELEIVNMANQLATLDVVTPVQNEVSSQGIVKTLAIIGVAYFVKASIKTCLEYYDNQMEERVVEIAQVECSICFEQCQPYMCCEPSLNQSLNTNSPSAAHYMCKSCALMNARTINSCPQCRHTTFVRVLPNGIGADLVRLLKLAQAGVPILRILDKFQIEHVFTLLDIINVIKVHWQERNNWVDVPGIGYTNSACTMSVLRLGFNALLSYSVGPSIVRWINEVRIKRQQDHLRSLIDEAERDPGSAELTPRERDAWVYLGVVPDRFWYPNGSWYAEMVRTEMQPVRASWYAEQEFVNLASGARLRVPRSQMDRPNSLSAPYPHVGARWVTTTPRRVMGNAFNESNYNRHWRSFPQSTVYQGDPVRKWCIHDSLVNNIEGARYEESKFVIVEDGAFVPVSMAICKDYCLLSEMDMKPIFQNYATAVAPYVTQFVLANQDKPDLRLLIADSYPSFCWPSWVIDIEQLPVETEEMWLNRLTIHPKLKLLLQASTVALAVFVAFKSVQSLHKILFKPSSQIIASGDEVIRKFKPIVRDVRHAVVKHQSSNNFDSIVNKVINNYVVIEVMHKESGHKRMLCGIGIKQRMAIIPKHYYEYLTRLDITCHELRLKRASELDKGVVYSFNPGDFMLSDCSDVAVFYLPVSFNMFKDITSYFGTDQDHVSKHSNKGVLIRVPTRTDKFVQLHSIDLQGHKKRQLIKGEFGTYESIDSMVYNYSRQGACGSVILVEDHTRPIRCIHIAGIGSEHHGTGYGAILTQEDLNNVPLAANTVHAQGVEEPDYVQDNIKMYLPEDSVVTYKGSVSKNQVPYLVTKTALKPSLIAEILPWESTKEPTILSKQDPRYDHEISPLVAGCAKHGYLTKDFDSQQLEEIAMVRSNQLLDCPPIISSPEKLTPEEAVVGLPNIQYYEPLKMNTSAGWPYCTTSKTLKKDWVILETNDQLQPISCTLHIDVKKEVERKEQLRKAGIVPVTLFVDTLKDEKKEKEKVRKLGGTRVFCASPFDFSIAMRQIFLHFVAMYQTNRNKLSHAVGISMFGHNVTELVNDLLTVSNNIITLDYSNFGPGFNATVAGITKQTIGKWVNEYVNGATPQEVECLIEENINSHHLMAGTIYQQRGGSPSGSPLTVVINSEENVGYIMLAWLNIVKLEVGFNRWDEYKKHVCLRVYGDDLIMSVSDKYIEQFNGITITNFFKEYGIVATDASKQKDVQKCTTILEASFMKHKFIPHVYRSGEWMAALDWKSVLETAMWIQEPICLEEATRINAEAAIRNAYGHGPEKFNYIRETINSALRKLKIDSISISWAEMDDAYYGEFSRGKRKDLDEYGTCLNREYQENASN